MSVARELWEQAQAEVASTCACSKDTEVHSSKVRERFLELWKCR